ncbi:hypothetical protein LEP48_14925 [Isoptericola sp. NEAU-Y5]|uniref:LysM domain-containing protein n=1 Tax=Isoptericola luteus TaxID=2879484 RepID=A0ABS7ZHW9_9MICO|nr:hypothetical protein [Isoptericola sp. NEAU-Y5]MCA5894631.1 hypothetical protein [Isoptericola sp. NEAU-Y5]
MAGKTTPPSGRGTGRLALVAAGALAAAWLLARRAWALLPEAGAAGETMAGLSVDHVVELVVVTAGALAGAWLGLSALVALTCVASGRLGRHWRAGWAVLDRVAPGAVRRLARSAVGVGVGTGLALAPTAALAADSSSDIPGGQGTPSVAEVIDLGWQSTPAQAPSEATDASTSSEDSLETTAVDAAAQVPADAVTTVPPPPDGSDATPTTETPAAAEDTAASETTESTDTTETTAEDDSPGPGAATTVARTIRPAGPDDGTHVVLRGDTLWDLAAERLDGSPSDADVLREVVRWHDANRDVIGSDPDVILPGQVLQVPK